MTLEETTELRKIRRERGWAWFWVLSCVPAVWLVERAIHSNAATIAIMLIWATGFVRNVARVIFSRCPRCRGLFFSTHGSPTMWNFFASKCMRCDLPLKAARVMYPSLE